MVDQNSPLRYNIGIVTNKERNVAKAQLVTLATQELAAIAFAAYRVNNNSIYKYNQMYNATIGDIVNVVTNKQLMSNTVGGNYADPEGVKLTVTEEDRTAAAEAINVVQQDCMLQTLIGRRISDFVQKVCSLADKETATEMDIGLMTYLPNVTAQIRQRQAADEAAGDLAFTSQYVGNIGEKIELDFTMVQSKYIQSINCWSVFGHDSNGNAIQYLTTKEELTKSARIKGKVKGHQQDQYRKNAPVTNLNYVKLA